MANAQSLDAIPLIRRKRAGEGEPMELPEMPQPMPETSLATAVESITEAEAAAETAMRMKARETVQLAAVHVRIPEQIARGLKLMSVLEGEQAQAIVAEALEAKLNAWNPNWRQSVPAKG